MRLVLNRQAAAECDTAGVAAGRNFAKSINVTLVYEMLPSNQSDYTGVSVCECLRLNAAGDYTPVGVPATVAGVAAMPRCAISHADGSVTLFASEGNTLYIIERDSVTPCDIGSPVVNVVAAGDDALVVTGDGGRFRCSRGDGEAWSVADDDVRLPVVELTCEDAGPLSCTVASRKLSQAYSLNYQFSQADRAALFRDFCDAYRAIDRDARVAGAHLQPVVAYYRLLDAAGGVLAVSPPMVLAHPDGAQCAGSQLLYSDDRQVVDAYTLSGRSWKVRARFPADASAASCVSRFELLATPMFHPADFSADNCCTPVRETGSTVFARISMSGAAVGITASSPLPSARNIRAAVARIESMAGVVYAAADPFSAAGSREITLDYAPAGDADSDIAAVRAAFARDVVSVPPVQALMSRPHCVTGAVAATASGVTLWGDLTVRRFAGHSPAAFAVEFADRSWYGYTVVTFADGSTRVFSTVGTGHAPLRFNPVLSYPSPDAVSLTIAVRSSGEQTRVATFPLVPDASGRRAVYVHPGCVAFEITSTSPSYSVPSETRSDRRLPSAIAVTGAGTPSEVLAVGELSAGAVSSLVPARFGQSSWDFGRCRFYACGEGGIHSVSVNAARSALSVSLLDSRPVAGSQAVAVADEAVMAVAGGDLVSVSASRVTTLRPGVEAAMIAWNGRRRELWCVDSLGRADVVCFDFRRRRYTRSGAGVRGVLSCAAGAYALTADGAVVDISREILPSAVAVAYVRGDRAAVLREPLSVSVDVRATSFTGFVALMQGRTGGVIALRRINGAVRSPLSFCVMSRPRRDVLVELQATVTPDFELRKISVNYGAD